MIRIIAIGKIKDPHLDALIKQYLKQIAPYHKIMIEEVKDEPLVANSSDKRIMDKEGERVLKLLKDDEYVVVLDLHGQSMDSLSFAAFIDRIFINYDKLTFVIGGSLGLADSLVKRANRRLQLSEMTFLHSMTRLILLEQIYRAFKINHHETYHK